MKKYEGELIYTKRDQFELIEVVDKSGIRFLHFGTPVEQSSMYLDNHFAIEMSYLRTMALSVVFKPDIKRVLCLGMGGGTLPKFIWNYYPRCHVGVVELSANVIDVAKNFFYVPHDSRLEIFCEDALNFLRTEPIQREDLLFIDLYNSQGMSSTIFEPDFFQNCEKRLAAGGILVTNVWRSVEKDFMKSLLDHLCEKFNRNLLILPTEDSGNFVILAFKLPLASYTKDLVEQAAQELQKTSGCDLLKIIKDVNFFKGFGYLFQDWT